MSPTPRDQGPAQAPIDGAGLGLERRSHDEHGGKDAAEEREHSVARRWPWLLPLAAGIFLGGAAIEMLPEALDKAGTQAWFWALGGLVLFVLLSPGARAERYHVGSPHRRLSRRLFLSAAIVSSAPWRDARCRCWRFPLSRLHELEGARVGRGTESGRRSGGCRRHCALQVRRGLTTRHIPLSSRPCFRFSVRWARQWRRPLHDDRHLASWTDRAICGRRGDRVRRAAGDGLGILRSRRRTSGRWS